MSTGGCFPFPLSPSTIGFTTTGGGSGRARTSSTSESPIAPLIATMRAFPAPTARTRPLTGSTVAMSECREDQRTGGSVERVRSVPTPESIDTFN